MDFIENNKIYLFTTSSQVNLSFTYLQKGDIIFLGIDFKLDNSAFSKVDGFMEFVAMKRYRSLCCMNLAAILLSVFDSIPASLMNVSRLFETNMKYKSGNWYKVFCIILLALSKSVWKKYSEFSNTHSKIIIFHYFTDSCRLRKYQNDFWQSSIWSLEFFSFR